MGRWRHWRGSKPRRADDCCSTTAESEGSGAAGGGITPSRDDHHHDNGGADNLDDHNRGYHHNLDNYDRGYHHNLDDHNRGYHHNLDDHNRGYHHNLDNYDRGTYDDNYDRGTYDNYDRGTYDDNYDRGTYDDNYDRGTYNDYHFRMSPLPALPPPRDYREQSCSAIPWHTTFIGQPMQHNFWLYAIVDRVMREVNLRGVIELGTGAGALSSVFGMWGLVKNTPVVTIDNVMRHNPSLLQKLGVQFIQQDIFSPETRRTIEGQSGPIWLFCDGGCKRKELEEYAPLLKPGSIVSAHDLGVEFLHSHAVPLCEAGVIEPFHPEWWMEANVQLALYKRL